MIINGKWMSEPEIIALISQLTADKKRLEKQLDEAKRLLKAAVEDINYYVDCYEAHCDECCCSQDNRCHWKHEAEALKLIGDKNNRTNTKDEAWECQGNIGG